MQHVEIVRLIWNSFEVKTHLLIVPDLYQPILSTDKEVLTRVWQSDCLNLEVSREHLVSDHFLHIYRLLFLFCNHLLRLPCEALPLKLLIFEAEGKKLDQTVWWNDFLVELIRHNLRETLSTILDCKILLPLEAFLYGGCRFTHLS